MVFTKEEEADMKKEIEAAAKMGNVKVKSWDEVTPFHIFPSLGRL